MTPEWVASARHILSERAASAKYAHGIKDVVYTFSEEFTETPRYAFPDGSHGGFWVRCDHGAITVGAGPLPEELGPADGLTKGPYSRVDSGRPHRGRGYDRGRTQAARRLREDRLPAGRGRAAARAAEFAVQEGPHAASPDARLRGAARRGFPSARPASCRWTTTALRARSGRSRSLSTATPTTTPLGCATTPWTSTATRAEGAAPPAGHRFHSQAHPLEQWPSTGKTRRTCARRVGSGASEEANVRPSRTRFPKVASRSGTIPGRRASAPMRGMCACWRTAWCWRIPRGRCGCWRPLRRRPSICRPKTCGPIF